MIAHRRRPPRSRPPAERASRARRDEGERGLSVVMVALFMVPLLILTALVVDVGVAKQRRRQVQAGADAAALAAAQELDGRSDQVARAVTVAKTWAARNVTGLVASDWAGCRDGGALTHRPDTGNTCISFDSASSPTRVRVRIPAEPQPQLFGQVAQPGPLQVTAYAVARRAPGTTASAGRCGLCAKDRVHLSGNQSIRVIGGGTIHATTSTLDHNTNGSTISPCPIRVANQTSSNGRCPGTGTQPAQAVGSGPVDPFASVPEPPVGIQPCRVNGQACNVNRSNAATLLKPNLVFTQGVELNNITLDLAPGRYYFSGQLRITGNVRLTGTGVTLFFVCGNSNAASTRCPNGQRGHMETTGSGNTVTLTPTAAPDPYAGISIYYERRNGQGTAPKFTGSSSTYDIGSIYADSGRFTNEGSRSLIVRGQIWGDFWQDNGGGSTTIHFDGGSTSTGSGGGAISLDG